MHCGNRLRNFAAQVDLAHERGCNSEIQTSATTGWEHFAPFEALTTPSAARLVKFAKVRAGQNVLNLGCGTGIVAIAAARIDARVRGVDLRQRFARARARERERRECGNRFSELIAIA
jgi:2-polyprenyl-3-methyl-5-hydroxy-6-metoxy-1,4-benzoquinol methylase